MKSRKNILIAAFLILIITALASESFSQEVGILSVGNNYMSEERYFNYQKINENGISTEFILPIKISKVKIYYKGNISYHRPQKSLPYVKKHYLSTLNELQVGTRTFELKNFYVKSFLGFGVMVEHIYSPGTGYSNGSFVFDLTNHVMYDFENIDVGLKFSLLYRPWNGYFDSIGDYFVQVIHRSHEGSATRSRGFIPLHQFLQRWICAYKLPSIMET
jgi:hypothetical protein